MCIFVEIPIEEVNMKINYRNIIALLLTLALVLCMTACGNKEEPEAAAPEEETQTEEAAEPEEEPVEVVKTIEDIDNPEELGPRVPLMIDSITLFEDGTVAIVPTDDLKKNEIKDEDEDAVYPFEESGKVKDVWVVDYGNGGYRTIIALMKDGSISAVNGRALVEDHIFAVMDNVANRDTFTDVENRTDEDASSIIGITKDGEEVILDYSLNFDEPEE